MEVSLECLNVGGWHENALRAVGFDASSERPRGRAVVPATGKKYDPKDPANQGNAEAQALYAAVHEAYRTLNDPESRRQYDQTLRGQSLSERVKAARAAQTPK